MEQVADDLVEPKVFLPDETGLPSGIRTLIVHNNDIKVVLDDPMGGNAIFEGRLEDKKMTGIVKYDDTDSTPPLALVWSSHRPKHDRPVEPKDV